MHLFWTATGTDQGKTYVLSKMVSYLYPKVQALKPIISGWSASEENDLTELLKAQKMSINFSGIQELNWQKFAAPLSPDQAAHLEGQSVDYEGLIDFCRKKMAQKTCWIEGVGGVMVPLTANKTVLDWMRALDCKVVLVTSSYLGTLSHTLTAVEVLKHFKIKIQLIIINQTPNSDLSLIDTQRSLQSFIADIPIMPWFYKQACPSTEMFSILGVDGLVSV